MSGLSQRRNGTMNRDVCSADIRSVEPKKITPSQMITGRQFLKKRRIFVCRACVSGAKIDRLSQKRLSQFEIRNAKAEIRNPKSPRLSAHFYGTRVGRT